MRLAITIGILAILAALLLGAYRHDQAMLREHLEQRDARHKEIQAWLDDVERIKK
jgi:hypothetical protein